jgi:translation initiation factor 5
MALIAIVGNLNKDKKGDPNYRYQMYPVVGKMEGKGNGSKTCIVNYKEIAKQLGCTPTVLCKFFGCELATRSFIKNDRAIINGHHATKVLQYHLNTFIDKFVLCPTCLLPETKLSVKKGDIYHKCKACGSKNLVDMNHKLCTLIVQEKKKEKEARKALKKKQSQEKKK